MVEDNNKERIVGVCHISIKILHSIANVYWWYETWYI